VATCDIKEVAKHFKEDITNIINTGKVKNGKAIPVTGRAGTQGCETSSLPYFLDNRLTDGSEVVSVICWQPFTPRKISGIHFC
jgi:hypothetical protein